MKFSAQTRRVAISGLSATTATLLLSASAVAASNSVIPCEQVGRDLKSLAVSVNELTLDPVDHIPVDQDLSAAIPDTEDANASEFVAPVLLLAPRVTNILREVFGDEEAEVAVVEPREPSSPLADREAATEPPLVPSSAAREIQNLPLYQRQMYRTDI